MSMLRCSTSLWRRATCNFKSADCLLCSPVPVESSCVRRLVSLFCFLSSALRCSISFEVAFVASPVSPRYMLARSSSISVDCAAIFLCRVKVFSACSSSPLINLACDSFSCCNSVVSDCCFLALSRLSVTILFNRASSVSRSFSANVSDSIFELASS